VLVLSDESVSLFINTGTSLLILERYVSTGIEAAVAMSYPEPENQGRFLGWWLSFRVGGQVLGGAINLGLSADRATAGKVDPKVYLVFIALQAVGPFAAFLLPPPDKVQRTDGLPVRLFVDTPLVTELKETAKLFFRKRVGFSLALSCRWSLIRVIYSSS